MLSIDSNTPAPYVVDLRSDTLTKPTDAMRRAMMEATFDDDVYDEEETVHKLQNKMAEMFGMEAALFVPSGTMANLISVLSHCQLRGQGVVVGEKSHIFLYEQAGITQLGGVHTKTLPELQDGTFDLDLLEKCITNVNDARYAWIGLVAIESTHSGCGGKALPLQYLNKLQTVCAKHGIPIHMDGARLMNASVAQNVELKNITRYVDSVTMCLSKGIGAPIGSIIGGSHEFIARATRLRTALGGGWRKPGPLAAAALIALEDAVPKLQNDHQHAKFLASVIAENSCGIVSIPDVETNLILVHAINKNVTADDISKRLNEVTQKEASDLQTSVKVKTHALDEKTMRLVLCRNNTTEDVQIAGRKICYILRELAELSGIIL